MSVKTDLIAAKALIDTPEKWRQDGKFGYGTEALCILGACGSVAAYGDFGRLSIALSRCLPQACQSYDHPVPYFNDLPTTAHADVMALFDRAIKAAA